MAFNFVLSKLLHPSCWVVLINEKLTFSSHSVNIRYVEARVYFYVHFVFRDLLLALENLRYA